MTVDELKKVLNVHGDIRHLEITGVRFKIPLSVHGDIRHLEKAITTQ